MGSCFSKCKPKKKFKEDCSHVHDKLVISQEPILSIPQNTTPILLPSQKPLSPAPSSSSTSSFSSFSCSNNSKCTLSSSTSSSCSSSSSSSVVITKDRSFSNEFLWSCVKENPHIITRKPVVTANKIHSHNLSPSSLVPKVKLPSHQEKAVTPKKRARSNSPTLTRQKSFRKEQNPMTSTPNRGLRSPSPSRRFNGENMSRTTTTNVTNENSYRRQSMSKGTNAANSCLKKESFRASPNRDLMMRSRNLSVRKKDVFCQQDSAKIIDGVGDGDVDDKGSKEMDIVMEDINNPLIALDCFIFL
ncbi:hypothetical protein CDL12_06454 [Handroanthus impetiginosus]|uniref:Uncharacterized protein n=1 Tax=Handroanthus impetiginosus TaxID=429701 RepID=A0A2G9HTJ8_9LAMI|nr:hypothetical protein CDL12_06454 [Handroanthus impetiginosus]